MQKYFLFIIGICAAIIQLLLFRETLSTFQEIDIIIGFFVAHSLLIFALSVFLSNRYKIISKTRKTFFVYISLLALSFLVSIFLIRSLRYFYAISLGGGISLKVAFISIFMILLPVSFLQGLVCVRALELTNKGQKSLNDNYLYLGFGLVLSGIIYALFLKYLPAINIVIVVWILSLLSAISFVARKYQIVLVSLSIVLSIISFTDFVKNSDKKILEQGFSNSKIEEYKYTAYGQNVFSRKNGELSLFVNHIQRFSIPDNDILNSQDFGHIPMLYHKNPKKVLIISQAAKYLPMVCHYDVKQIDYVEPDEAIIEFINNNIKHTAYFSDKRLVIHNENARGFIKYTEEKYDVILIGLSEPINLHINGYYTKDFFKKVKNILNKKGFLALKLPGKMGYSTSIMAEMNKSVFNALENEFENVAIIPGRSNILIATDNQIPYRMHIKERLKKIQDKTLVLSKTYIDNRMDTMSTRWLKRELAKVNKSRITNSDLNPKAMILTLLYKQSAFAPYLSLFLDKLLKYSYGVIIVIIVLFFLSHSLYTTTAFASGASSAWLVFDLIFAMQIFIGQIFMWSGYIISAFILGLILSIYYVRNTNKFKIQLYKRMFRFEIIYMLVIILWSLLLHFKTVNVVVSSIIVLFLGFLTGVEFILLRRMSGLLNKGKKTDIYTLGTFGAWCAIFFGGGFLIIAWGIKISLMVIFLFKFLLFCRWAELNQKHFRHF